jgi:hypothetical protein
MVTGTPTKLSIEEIGQKAKALGEEIDQLNKQYIEIQSMLNERRTRLTRLQWECPHPTTVERWEQDVAEMKVRNICTVCGDYA